MNTHVRIPQPVSVETAIRLYYENIELSNKDIRVLYGKISSGRIVKLKELAKNQMDEDGILGWDALRVDTKAAYKAWGLDISDLEQRYSKLQKLNHHGDQIEV